VVDRRATLLAFIDAKLTRLLHVILRSLLLHCPQDITLRCCFGMASPRSRARAACWPQMVCFELDAAYQTNDVSDNVLDTESTITMTIQSFVTVVASPPTTSPSARSSNGLGDYIMQGLSESSVSSTAQVLPGPVSAPFPSKNATAAAGWQACQTSQISWSDAWTSAYQPEIITWTSTYTKNKYTQTLNVTFGNSDVYTTIDGIPHAHGEIEPTSTSQFVE
jgi:hypothetical protein